MSDSPSSVAVAPAGPADRRAPFDVWPLRTRAWWIVGGYTLFATLWILFSDEALRRLIDDPRLLIRISIYKGLAFVIVTALLLLVLVWRVFGAMETGYAALREHKTEIERLNRLYAALSRINQTIVRAGSRDDLCQKVCDVLVQQGGFTMAWIGRPEPETRRLLPVARAGDDNGYLQTIYIYTDDRPEGRGPTGRAFREGRPYICNDIFNDAITQPWRAEMARRGILASAAFPIRHRQRIHATLTVYANTRGFFQDREAALLEKAAGDIGFALDNFDREAERARAEELARREEQFSAAMIESMPGIVYFYDEHGRFLRWNRNFEIVSGYSTAEITQMHPLDFFAEADRAVLGERIAEVFTRGDAFVEAPFRSKDGRTTPYLFTGRRVVFNNSPCLVGMGVDITARTEAEQRWREAQDRLEVVTENLREGLIIATADGELFRWNTAALRMYGFDNPEQAHAHLQDLTSVFDLATLDGAVLPPEQWPFARVLRGEALAGLELRIRRRDRDWTRVFSYAGSRERYRDGQTLAFLTVQDITQRHAAEEGLRASEKRYRTTLESMMEGCQLIGFDWRYLYLNAAAARHNRRSNEDLLGRTFTEAWPGIEPSAVYRLLQRCMTERIPLHDEVEFAFADGGKAWFDVRTQPVPEGIFVLSLDITERKQAEMTLRVLNRTLELQVADRTAELQAALTRAEAADRLKSAFLATMSHELRTPLNSIIGFTGIVLQGLAGPLNAEQTKQLGMVRGSARHLLELINDVLDISKIEAGQLEVRAEPFDLAASLERVVASVKPLAEQRGLALTVVVPPALGEMISDRRRVEQILLNLLNNALKFTERGGVSLTVERVPDFQAEPDAAPRPAVRLRVADTGIGIRPEDLATLFQPFRQIDTGLTREHEGTGLGLAICRRLALLLGGTISATSVWSQGSEFTVLLPLQPAPKP
ncbi:MAG TPA: PAS domain S-box protein [Verrucomicrobiae bacterium]|nr:PAS domain S-box protein [Verrucomicrobiae bacterium]